MLLAILATLVTVSVLLPTYAAVLDPYYAERLPGHTHLLFEQAERSHGHSYAPVTTTGGGAVDNDMFAIPDPADAGLISVVSIVATVLILAGALSLTRPLTMAALRARVRTLGRGLTLTPDSPPLRLSFAV